MALDPATPATLGSIATLVSSGVNLATPFINNLLKGTPQQQRQQPNRYGQQGADALNALFSSGTTSLQNPNQGFEPFAQQARGEFYGKSLPSLAERFSRYPGQLGSSGARNALGSASGEFEQGLASAASSYGLQNREQGVRELLAALTPEFLAQLSPEKQGLIQQLLPSLVETAPRLIKSIGGLAQGGGFGTDWFKKLASLFQKKENPLYQLTGTPTPQQYKQQEEQRYEKDLNTAMQNMATPPGNFGVYDYLANTFGAQKQIPQQFNGLQL